MAMSEEGSRSRFGDTSAAAPQVAALAYHLYSKYPELGQTSYDKVPYRIVEQRRKSLDAVLYPLKGVADYHAAIGGWNGCN